MKSSAPPLLPIFRSRLQGELLAALLLVPDAERSLTELADRAGGSVATAQREVERLEQAGIVRSRRVGRTRLVSADTASAVFEPLARLVLVTFGPPQVVSEELGEVADIDEAYLFGSWAARASGVPGSAPNDVDVLVVGEPDRDQVHDAALRAERRLGLAVNITVRRSGDWRAGREGFIREVKASPLVRLLPDLAEGGGERLP